MELLDKYLKKRKMSLKSGFSIKMPNNYVIMGNVDKKEYAEKKLKELLCTG
jgi:hypothetical protein